MFTTLLPLFSFPTSPIATVFPCKNGKALVSMLVVCIDKCSCIAAKLDAHLATTRHWGFESSMTRGSCEVRAAVSLIGLSGKNTSKVAYDIARASNECTFQ